MSVTLFIFGLFLALSCLVPVINGFTKCIPITEINFPKLLPRFEYMFVQFDRINDPRDQYRIFERLALEQQTLDNILFGVVQVEHYFRNRNMNFALHYNVTKKDYPTMYLFKHGDDVNPVMFSKDLDFTVFNLRMFVKNETGLELNEPGRMEGIERLANGFIVAEDKEDVLKEAKLFVANLADEEDQKLGKMYVEVMERIKHEGYQFIKEETDFIMSELAQGSDQAEEYIAQLLVYGGFPIPKIV